MEPSLEKRAETGVVSRGTLSSQIREDIDAVSRKYSGGDLDYCLNFFPDYPPSSQSDDPLFPSPPNSDFEYILPG